MKALWLAGTCLATALMGPFCPSNALASGLEAGKFVNQLVIDSSGTIAFTVLDPDDSTSCTLHLIIVDAQKDRIYSLLLAAKSTNKPINVNFDNACKVTSIALP